MDINNVLLSWTPRAPSARPSPTAPSPAAPALGLDLFAAGDIRPVWERNRWAELPLLAQAARLEPAGGGASRRRGRCLADWAAANPAFRGPNWACGQEAALRALHLALALALLRGPRLPPGARRLLALHGRRIAATPAYALAQDNNHAISEPAGLLACGLLLGEAGWAPPARPGSPRARRRLVAPDGGFAQLSTGYHRLLLDVLAVAEWLRRRHGLPATAAEGAAAAARWLHRLVRPRHRRHAAARPPGWLRLRRPGAGRPGRCPRRAWSGPRGCWPAPSRGFAGDPGCAWLGLAAAPALPPPEPAWVAAPACAAGRPAGRAACSAPARSASARAMPTCCTSTSGTGRATCCGMAAPAPTTPGTWLVAGTAGPQHGGVRWPRSRCRPCSRFLFARWPRGGPLPDGAGTRDTAATATRAASPGEAATGGWRTARRPLRAMARCAGTSRPGPWRLTPDGAEGPPPGCRHRRRPAGPGAGNLARESRPTGACGPPQSSWRARRRRSRSW